MRFMQIATLGIVVATLGAASLLAQDSDIVAQRQTTMKGLGDEAKAIKNLVTGPEDQMGQVKDHALKISEAAAKIPTMFPAGSDQGKTEALPAVWTDKDGFDMAAEKMGKLADQLAAAADTGDAQQVRAAFAALGKEGCGGCHTTYRKPQD